MTAIDTAELIIRLSVSATMIAFGFAQLIKPAAWLEYLPGWLRWLLPVSPESFMRSHGIQNILLGAWLASGLAQVVAVWAAIAWWTSILPFAFRLKWTLGMRDLTIIMSLVSLLLLVGSHK